MLMKFNTAYDQTRNISQSFDRKKIFLKRGGKTYNVYDEIQANNVDLNIYEILEKYNCSKDIAPSQAGALINNANKMNGMYGDFTQLQEIGDARDIIAFQNKANEMFLQLPLEIRKHFDNNALKFANEGEKWLQEQLKKAKEKPAPEPAPEGDK